MTKYAQKICQIISSSRRHMTAEQIFDALRQAYPTVALATVYNNLNKLWRNGWIRKVSLAGMPDRYDRVDRHDHLVCRECGRLVDIQLTDLTQALQAQVKVPILCYDLKLMYICEDCRKKMEGKKRMQTGELGLPGGSFNSKYI